MVTYNTQRSAMQAAIQCAVFPSMTPEQCRAARGWLGWSQLELARRANVSLRTIQAFEKGGRAPIANNIAAMRRSFEEVGVHLMFHQNGAAAGIVYQHGKSGLPTGLLSS